MAGTPTFKKRDRERARQEHQRQKTAKRRERQLNREKRPEGDTGEDPDIAGIVPGPQPPNE